MSIRIPDLLAQKARKFGASTEDVQFRALCSDAINYALDDIENIVGVATTRILPQDTTIDLDAQMFGVEVSMGMDFYLQDSSEFQVQPLAGVEARYKDKLRTARMRYERTLTIHTKRGNLE